ncbi:phage neck terminator protein [Serratia marcescens]
MVLDADEMPDVSALKAFLTVGRVSSEPLGQEYRFDGAHERETVTVSRLTVLSVNAYGRNAYPLIEKLGSALSTSAAQSALKRAGAAIMRLSPTRNLPTAIAGGFEQRAQIDISLSHVHRVEAQVYRAQTVEIIPQEDKQ